MTVRVAIVGGGLMGRQHIKAMGDCDGVELACIVDPVAPDADVVRIEDAPEFDVAIIATPNHLHAEHALAAMDRCRAVLVEKPLAHTVAAAEAVVAASARTGVPVLVGYHRRHSPVTAAARAALPRLGTVVSAQATCWLMKPDDYFAADWRTQPGAGPLGLNAVHDLDLMGHLLGPVVSVQAMGTNRHRGFAVQDSLTILLEHAGGALTTLSVSDTVVAPWSYELTAGENPAYPWTGQSCYLIGGTHGALELPVGRLWSQPERGWWEVMESERLEIVAEDPLVRQIAHLCAVARGEASPLVTAQDGLANMLLVAAVAQSMATGARVSVGG